MVVHPSAFTAGANEAKAAQRREMPGNIKLRFLQGLSQTADAMFRTIGQNLHELKP